jgi:acyl carrier protein
VSDTNTETFERFKARAVELLSVQPAQVTLDASFADDLEADSLDLTELVMALEEEFDIEVDEDDLEGIKTVGDAFALIERLVSAKA